MGKNWSKFEEKWRKWNFCPPGIVRLATALYSNLFQGNLRGGEPVAAAILESHMEQSYCTSRFFCSSPSKDELPFSCGLNHKGIIDTIGESCSNDNACESCKWFRQIRWYDNSLPCDHQYGHRSTALTQGWNREAIPLLNFLDFFTLATLAAH